MKIILVIIDGLGDKPIKELGDRTPLEAAKTPNLDWLAKNGKVALIRPFLFNWQKNPESDTNHLALFGYDPDIYYLGRGVYEAAGIGINLKKGDVAFRANFATVDKNLKIIDRRAGRISDTEPLVKAISGIKIEGVKFLVKKSAGHRAVLILRGKNISEKVGGGDVKEVGIGAKKIIPKEKTKKAFFTAKILNDFLERVHKILLCHPLNKNRLKRGLAPANYLLIRGAGIFRKTPSFKEKYGLKACCVAGGPLYRGIAKILGMSLIKVKGANGLADTNLKRKFLAVKENLKKYNFVFCHIKAVDSLAEDGDFRAKKKFIEKIDKNLEILINHSHGRIRISRGQRPSERYSHALKNILLVITADHSTCSLEKSHCKEPVPLLIYNSSEVKNGRRLKFSEKECRRGKLGKIKQIDLMKKILNLAKN